MKQYSLYQVTKNGKKFFFVKFVDEATGKQMSPKSVEGLRKKLGITDRHHVSKRSEAEFIVQKAIEKGLDGASNSTDPLFIDYLYSFWDFGKSPYIESRNADGVIRVGQDYCMNRFSNIKNHIEPFRNSYVVKNLLGEPQTKPGFLNQLRCSQVKRSHIKDIQEVVVREKGVTVWINCKRTLSVPIKQLIRNNILFADPMLNIDNIPTTSKSTVGTLTRREMTKLIMQMFHDAKEGYPIVFNRGSRYKTVQKNGTFKLDERIFLATALSCLTGMRKGEILGLRVKSVRFPNADDRFETEAIIDIDQAYARKQGFKLPKCNKKRRAPCPKWLAEELISFAMTNPRITEHAEEKSGQEKQEIINNSLVFFSDSVIDRPYDAKTLDKWFDKEVEKLMSKEERISRHIVFHSLRHFFNTEAVAVIGSDLTKTILGHSFEGMAQRYFNGSDDETILDAGLKVQDLIPNPYLYLEAAE